MPQKNNLNNSGKQILQNPDDHIWSVHGKHRQSRVVRNLHVTTDRHSDGLLSSRVRKEYCLRELPMESRQCFFLFLTKWFRRTVSLGFHRFCRFLTDFRRFFFSIGILLFSCSEYVSFFIPRQNPGGFFVSHRNGSDGWCGRDFIDIIAFRLISDGIFHRYHAVFLVMNTFHYFC